jgi:hypothetical protein
VIAPMRFCPGATLRGERQVSALSPVASRLVETVAMSSASEDLETEVSLRLAKHGFVPHDLKDVAVRDWWGVILKSAYGKESEYWRCFDLLSSLMTDQEYADTLREVWVAVNGLPPPEARRRLQDHGRSISQRMWTAEEYIERLQSLPEDVPVFRACRLGTELGWSWALSRESAMHFASSESDYDPPKVLLSGTVSKGEIIGLFLGAWDEDEVVVPGEKVAVVNSEPIVL